MKGGDDMHYLDIYPAYFRIQNKQNENTTNAYDTQAYLTNNSINFNVEITINFGSVMKELLKKQNYYMYLTVFSENSDIDERILLDQRFGEVPNGIGSTSFGARFPVQIDGNLIKHNNVKTLELEFAISNYTENKDNFMQSLQNDCFFKTVIPIWGN